MPNTHEESRRRSAEMLQDPRYRRVVQTVQCEINRFRAGGGVAEAGDGHGGDGGPFVADVESLPRLVKAPVAPLGPVPDGGRLTGLAAHQLPAGTVPLAVVPGRLHQ